ncbi:MAG: M48 family metallopeptidase [Candidatus Altiarchaeota archaeon]|nr:M48 family metallopeptidase [Candidatus Altiarchaeota archaeon]
MERVSFYTQISKNKRDSILIVVPILLFVVVIVLIMGEVFVPEVALFLAVFATVFVLIDAWASYRYGDKVVISSVKAYEPDPVKHAYYINTVEGLALAAGIPKPKAYIIPSKEINAFATGRDPKNASMAVTEGALEKLNRQELEGVIAHEMSHIGNYDIRFALMVAIFVGLIAILSHMFLRSLWYGGGGSGGKDKGGGVIIMVGIILAILAPIAARLAQLAISRRREYLADATGAKLTRYPAGLASALEKIKTANQGNMNVSEAMSHLFISDPKKSFADNIFATHPPIDDRITKLRAM